MDFLPDVPRTSSNSYLHSVSVVVAITWHPRTHVEEMPLRIIPAITVSGGESKRKPHRRLTGPFCREHLRQNFSST